MVSYFPKPKTRSVAPWQSTALIRPAAVAVDAICFLRKHIPVYRGGIPTLLNYLSANEGDSFISRNSPLDSHSFHIFNRKSTPKGPILSTRRE